MKNANEFEKILRDLNACSDAVEWAEGKTWEQVYEECPRGDWLLWLFSKVSDDHRKLVLAGAHCANTVRRLMKDERSKKAVDVAIKYGNNDSTKDELKTAAIAAAYTAVSYAADAAAYAADAYADVYAAATAAAYAVAATAYAKIQNQKQTADIVRKFIPIEDFNLENKAL